MSKNARLLAMFVITSALGLYLAYRERGNRESAMANEAPTASPASPAPAEPAAPEPTPPIPAAPALDSSGRPLRPNPEDIIRPIDSPRPRPSERVIVPPAEPPPTPATSPTRPRDN